MLGQRSRQGELFGVDHLYREFLGHEFARRGRARERAPRKPPVCGVSERSDPCSAPVVRCTTA